MSDIRILIVDPAADFRATVKTHAAMENFTADEAADGISAIKMFRRHDYHVIVMNAELPELDSWHVCKQIRKSAQTPIIMLSKDDSDEHKLNFFDIGVDDFLIYPFSCKVLMAKIHVLLRHSAHSADYTPRRLIYDGMCIDTVSHMVYIDGEGVMLTPKVYKLLVFLAKNPNRTFSRDMILREVWGDDFYGTDRTVDTHIKILRESIRPYHTFIETVWGIGYIFKT